MERSGSIQKLEEDYTYRPYVCFEGVGHLLDDLRRHVEWSPTHCVDNLVFQFQVFRKSKVSYFNAKLRTLKLDHIQILVFFFFGCQLLIWEVDHYVLQLQISVNNLRPQHIVDTSHKHYHYLMNHTRINVLVFFVHKLFQVSTIAIVHEDVIVRLGFDSLFNSNYVATLYGVLILNFIFDHFLLSGR